MEKGGIEKVAIEAEQKIIILDKNLDLKYFFIKIFIIFVFQKMIFCSTLLS